MATADAIPAVPGAPTTCAACPPAVPPACWSAPSMNSIAALPTTRCSASPPSAPGDRSRTISPPNHPAQSRNSAAHTGAGTGRLVALALVLVAGGAVLRGAARRGPDRRALDRG